MRDLLFIVVSCLIFSVVSFGQKWKENEKKAVQAYESGQHKNAADYYSRAIVDCDNCSDSELFPLYMGKGKSELLTESFDRAYESFSSALKSSYKLGKNAQMKALVSFAEYHRKIGNYEGAREFIQKAESIVSDPKVSNRSKAHFYNRYAAIINENNISGASMDSVIRFSYKAADLARSVGDAMIEAASLNELAFIFEHTNRTKQALVNYRLAALIWRENGERRHAANAYANMARTSIRTGNSKEGLKFVEEGLKLCGNEDWSSIKIDLYLHKTEALKYLGKHEEALAAFSSYHEELMRYRQRTWSDEMAKISGKLELEKKERKISEERSQKLSAQKELKEKKAQQATLYTLLAIILILMAVVCIFLIRYLASNRKLKEYIEERELLLKEMHHRVKNNMQMVSSLLDLQSNFTNDEVAIQTLNNGKKRLDAFALAHQHLYTNENYKSIKIDDYVGSILENVCDDDLRVQSALLPVELDIEKAQAIGFIINELVLNSIKHAWKGDFTDKKISIVMSRNSNGFEIEYKDNGIGILDHDSFLNSPTFGVTLIKSFVKRNLQGEMSSEEADGIHLKFKF